MPMLHGKLSDDLHGTRVLQRLAATGSCKPIVALKLLLLLEQQASSPARASGASKLSTGAQQDVAGMQEATALHCSPSAWPSACLPLLIPSLHPLARANGPVRLLEDVAPLIILPILLSTFVVLVVAGVTVSGLVCACSHT